VRIGVTLPQTEIGSDPAVLRDYAQTAESLGYDYINIYDHVLGAQPGDHRPGWSGGYDYRTNFHEPFVLYGYLGAITSKVELVTGILILPQRQTALVAKQAAEVDILSNGRLRLGVAIGWNDAEYEALNEDFHERGRKIVEQIEVLRMLWSQEVVTFEGRWHHLNHVAIEPRPSRRIPVWMGGMSETVMKRAARVADGWMPNFRQEGNDSRGTIERFFAYVREYGRVAQPPRRHRRLGRYRCVDQHHGSWPRRPSRPHQEDRGHSERHRLKLYRNRNPYTSGH
jgi:probable F420-dependent oxidoreductase